MTIERAVEEFHLIGIEALRLVAEGIGRELGKRGTALTYFDHDVSFQPRSGEAVEPFGIQLGIAGVADADHLRRIEVDFQTVRFHRLHSQVFVDDRVTHLEGGSPQTCFIVGAGGHIKGIDASHGGIV